MDLKHGNVIKSLIPKAAEGIFNKIYRFNETDEYILYYHGGRKSLQVFRVFDGIMIANYRVPANLTSLESTTDGNNIILGMVDGKLIVLTIADPNKKEMDDYLKLLPSRKGLLNLVTRKPSYEMSSHSQSRQTSIGSQ